MRCYKKNSFSILLSLLLIIMPIFASKVFTLSTSCQTECGNIKIPYPFGIEKGCYLNEWYKIECKNATFSFLSKMGMEVVNISLPGDGDGNNYHPGSFGIIRVKIPITSIGCSRDGKESRSVLNLTESPFFFGSENSLVAVGCNSKASLTNIEPSKVGCELNCTSSKEKFPSKNIPFLDTGCSSNALPYTYTRVCTKNKGQEEKSCDGNGCCLASLPDPEPQQVIGVRIESFDYGNTTRQGCRVAFLTDEVYMLSNATKPERFFAKGYSTATMGWVILTKNLSFINSLSCKETEEYDNSTYNIALKTSCKCNNITMYGTNYANCKCARGYRGNPYHFGGCKG